MFKIIFQISLITSFLWIGGLSAKTSDELQGLDSQKPIESEIRSLDSQDRQRTEFVKSHSNLVIFQ
jgi:hypothetical protein